MTYQFDPENVRRAMLEVESLRPARGNPIRRTPMVRQRGTAALSELADDPRWLPHTDPGRSWDALLDQLEAVGLRVVPARDRE